MKVKKVSVICALVMCAIFFFASLSNAAPKFYVLTVLEVGMDEVGDYMIKVEASNGKQRVYLLPDTDSAELNRYLAVAMAAMSSGMKVRAYVDWSDWSGTYVVGSLTLVNE